MGIDDITITKTIFNRFTEEFKDFFDIDIAIAGAGPSGLTAARYLAEVGRKVAIFERKLSIGGGMWGGGMMFPVIVVQDEAKHLLEECNIDIRREGRGYWSADSIEAVVKLCSKTIDAGAKIFNGISVEDVLLDKDNRVNGFVINWSSIDVAGLHVDPLTIRAKYCIDATGHAAEICSIVKKKVKPKTGLLSKDIGEFSMHADIGEKAVVENTREVYPG
ncbi:MAG TPA: thiazole biosynthesis protein, partial [Thermoplasmatales archaeon]|nr:thiazole biosynthesis protein [Thermoplasmatales archaeon]